jgi:hypothetical protein
MLTADSSESQQQSKDSCEKSNCCCCFFQRGSFERCEAYVLQSHRRLLRFRAQVNRPNSLAFRSDHLSFLAPRTQRCSLSVRDEFLGVALVVKAFRLCHEKARVWTTHPETLGSMSPSQPLTNYISFKIYFRNKVWHISRRYTLRIDEEQEAQTSGFQLLGDSLFRSGVGLKEV